MTRILLFILSLVAMTTLVNAGNGDLDEPCEVEYNQSSGHYQDVSRYGYLKCNTGLMCVTDFDTGVPGAIFMGTCQPLQCFGGGPTPASSTERITICHRACSETNPWVRITIDKSAWDDSITCKHGQHTRNTCGDKNFTLWGDEEYDYVLMDHGSRDDVLLQFGGDNTAANAYWDSWEPACPFVRNGACCTGSKCCNGVIPPPTATPSAAPSPSPTVGPTRSPTSSPSVAPTSAPTLGPQDQWECLTAGTVAEPFIQLKSTDTTCTESVTLSTHPHEADANGDIELIVEIENQHISSTGYQPQLVLFFAKPTTTLTDVTTDDNGWSFFESKVVSWMKAKIHATLVSSTYFYAKTLNDQGELALIQDYAPMRMEQNGAMKIRRDSEGKVHYSYSFDQGATWKAFKNSGVLLPVEFRTGPLKVGYRIKREWKCYYDIITKATINSGGEMSSSPTVDPIETYFYDAANNYVKTSTVTTTSTLGSYVDGLNGACGSTGDREQPILLSTETFNGDVCLTVHVKDRVFDANAGYQAGVWAFFTTADKTVADLKAGDGDFVTSFAQGSAIASVGEKVHKDMSTSWFELHSENSSGTYTSQYGADNWSNDQNDAGYIRLCRENGRIYAEHTPNGEGWQRIGNYGPVMLPDNTSEGGEDLRLAPIKIGFAIKYNYACSADLTVVTTVTHIERTALDATDAPTPAPVSNYVAPTKKTNYFNADNSWCTADTVAFSSGALLMTGNNQTPTHQSMCLSKDTWSGDVSLVLQIIDREYFCEANEQVGIWLFVAPESATLEGLYATDADFSTEFQANTVAAVGDKITKTDLSTTWFELYTSHNAATQPTTSSYRNLEGFMKLERGADGFIRAFQSEGAEAGDKESGVPATWTPIGSSVELPASLKTAPIRVGIAIKFNGEFDYQLSLLPYVDSTAGPTPTRRNLRG